MANYNVRYTDLNNRPITIPEGEVNDTSLDVVLFGRINPEYGEVLDEDLLNILENFACPEVSTTTGFETATPDLDQTSKSQLQHPTVGQLWFNSTRDTVYYWRGDKWQPIPLREYYAANWGSVMDGQQLPKPVSPVTGYTFEYSDCIWSVAPAAFTSKFGNMTCTTDSNAVVDMKYRIAGTSTVIAGLANYLIIGIRGNYNAGQDGTPLPFTPTPTPTPTVTNEASPTPTPTATPAPTATRTPLPSTTPQPTPDPTVSPTVTPTRAATVTPTGTPPPSSTPAPSATPSPVNPLIGGNYSAGSVVMDGATAGAGIGFLNTGATGRTGQSVSGPTRWLQTGYNASDYEVSFTGDWLTMFPMQSGYSTPAGNDTMGSPSTWYNLGTSVAWSVWTTRDMADLAIGYTIRKVGDPSVSVTGSINVHGTAGTPI